MSKGTQLTCLGRSDLCLLRYDQITLPGTHNSGSGFNGDLKARSGAVFPACFIRNQNLNYTGQLEFGIRFFSFDLCWVSNEEATTTVPAGLWTCHSTAYAGKLELALNQINDWMNTHTDQIASLYFNGDYDRSRSQSIAQALFTLLESMWEPTQKRIASGAVYMNTNLNTTGQWPTLNNVIINRGRLFVFVHETLQMVRKPWIHDPIPNTSPRETVIDNCNSLITSTKGMCNVCEELFTLEVIASRGRCIIDNAVLCNNIADNVTEACYSLRRQYGKTINVIEVDFPSMSPKGPSVVQIADMINDRNVQYFSGSAPRPSILPTPSNCFPGFTPTPSPSPRPQPSTHCEALRLISERPFIYFLCQPNSDCDRLICPVDLMNSGGTAIFTFEFAILTCTYPFVFDNLIKLPTGSTIAQYQIKHSGIFSLIGINLNITLDQIGSSVGLSVSCYCIVRTN